MQISKDSWHYRLNEKAQSYSFEDRVRSRRFTTCTYIRTTIRSMFQVAFMVAVILTLAVAVVGVIINALWTPLAIWLSLPLIKSFIVLAVITWLGICLVGAAYILSHVSKIVREKLSERYDKKLTLLEQRIKDGKEGICTIVEVA